MRLFFLLLCLLSLPLSCASAPGGGSADSDCLSASETAAELAKLEKMVSPWVGSDSGQTRLIEDQCTKKVFERGEYRLVVYRDHGGVSGNAALQRPPTALPAEECFARAMADLDQLDIPGSEVIMVRHRVKYASLWNDFDIGPARWLRCERKKNVAYYESVQTLLHELNHQIREKHCLVLARTNETLCFTGAAQMPRRSIAKLDRFPTAQADMIASLRAFQGTYLTQVDEAYPLLVDELNAYTVTTRALKIMLEKLGPLSVAEGKVRGVVFLPLVMVWTTQYLERAQKLAPSAFELVLGKRTKNRKHLRKFIEEAETEYRGWLVARVRFGLSPIDLEEGLWSEYLKTKKRVF